MDTEENTSTCSGIPGRRALPARRRAPEHVVTGFEPGTLGRDRQQSEVLLIAPLEIIPRVRVALAAEVLERVCGGDAAHPRAALVRQIERDPLHHPAAVSVADAGRIDDAM